MTSSPLTFDILNKADVQALLGVSERCLENMVRKGQFPPPVRLGKRAVWLRDVVQAWLQQAFSPQRNFQTARNIALDGILIDPQVAERKASKRKAAQAGEHAS